MRPARRVWIVAAGTVVLALVGGSSGLTASGSPDQGGGPAMTSRALDRAGDAALQAAGGGTVAGMQVIERGRLFEVVVTLDDGRRLDVWLDGSLAVVDAAPAAPPGPPSDPG